MPTSFPVVVKSSYNPYGLEFPRGKFLAPLLKQGDTFVHPFNRKAQLDYFKSKNPQGYHHDLGAQDVFLDNFGMLIAEQFTSDSELASYFRAVHHCLQWWTLLRMQVVQDKPWWGINFNSLTRQANAGEPRSLLRFMGNRDWAEFDAAFVEDLFPHKLDEAEQLQLPASEELMALPDYPQSCAENLVNPWEEFGERFPDFFRKLQDWRRLEDWEGTPLIPDDWSWDGPASLLSDSITPSTGVELPADWPKRVDRMFVLHPDQSTPDLPTRVGILADDLRLYGKILRHQGQYGTCVAHALSVGLDLLVRRQHMSRGRRVTFSPAWLHCTSAATGQTWEDGRSLKNAIETLRVQLPCSEDAFPYQRGPVDFSAFRTASREAECRVMTHRFGLPVIRKVAPTEIAQIKALLAAGWLVVVTTSLTQEFMGRGLRRYGLPLSPLIGQTRSKWGHAWLLVGYDHVDGQSQWKYQGRFIALNSWGSGWPAVPTRCAGLCHLPFAMFLSEGIEAYALRLPQ